MRVTLLCILLVSALALLCLQEEPVAPSTLSRANARQSETISPPSAVDAEAGPLKAVEVVDQVDSATGPDSIAAVASAIKHAASQDQQCLAGTRTKASAQSSTIHRWTDEAGIIHFSDQAPAAGAMGHRRIEVQGLPPVRVEARGIDMNLPDFVVQRATTDVQAIERIMRDSLGVTGDPGLELRIEFIASAETYAKRIGDAALANSDGTYSSRDRTIRIRKKDQDELNFQILRHEMTHALVHEHIGLLHTSINEGLAGYFQNIEVAGMGARIVLDSARRRPETSMSTDGQEELIDLLAREGSGFYGAGQELRYFRAMALIGLLMEHVEGREALSTLLLAQRAQPCQPVEPAPILGQAYPGGLESLARDWSNWMRNPMDRVITY